jgi:hypothetical protein
MTHLLLPVESSKLVKYAPLHRGTYNSHFLMNVHFFTLFTPYSTSVCSQKCALQRLKLVFFGKLKKAFIIVLNGLRGNVDKYTADKWA